MGKFLAWLYEELSLYVRHAAWLQAVPEHPGKKIAGPAAISRLQTILDAGNEPDMPPVAAGYIIGYLFDIGPTIETGMGAAPLSQGEIALWQCNIGVELHPWEVRFIRSLSREYLSQLQKSEKPDCPAPYGIVARRALVASKIDALFG